MDKIKAHGLEQIMVGQKINGYKIIRLLDYGKSAAVFNAEKDGNVYAVKVFDNELVERFGQEIQKTRIEQELSLIGHDIPNLVKIIDGGEGAVSGYNYSYIVMAYIEGENLKKIIENNSIDVQFAEYVFKVLLDVADALLDKNIVHRDIKPENIMIDSGGAVWVMDLGVIKQIGAPSFTDVDEKQFVGTLRYAPPEFLLRKEKDNGDGWKAVNIYQIGAVLHDLIMGKELFIDQTPYSNLVIAIKEDMPSVNNQEYTYPFLGLVRNMLNKNPERRLELFNSVDLENVLNDGSHKEGESEDIIDRIKTARIPHIEALEEIDNIQRSNEEKRARRLEISNNILSSVDEVIFKLKELKVFSNLKNIGRFQLREDHDKGANITKNDFYTISGKLEEGFFRPIHFWVRLTNDESYNSSLGILLILPNSLHVSMLSKTDIRGISSYIDKIAEGQGSRGQRFSFEFYSLFDGTLEIDDGFKGRVETVVLKFIEKALDLQRPEVKNELEFRRKTVDRKSSGGVMISTRAAGRTMLINKL